MKLTHYFEGDGFPVSEMGLPNWKKPERIAGMFKVVHWYDWNRYAVLSNGEGAQWAVPTSGLRLADESKEVA